MYNIFLCSSYHDLELSTLRQLLSPPSHQDGISEGAEVIHSHGNWVEIVSSHATSAEYLSSLGLDHCTHVGHMGDIIANELRENMETLQYHVAEGSSDHTLDGVHGSGNGREDLEDATEHVQNVTGGLGVGRGGGKDRVLRSQPGAPRDQGENGEVKSHGYQFDRYVSRCCWFSKVIISSTFLVRDQNAHTLILSLCHNSITHTYVCNYVRNYVCTY